jgi:tRNA pseudouridine55 synthase
MEDQIDNLVLLNKKLGETPLECILRFKSANPKYEKVPMTYAGRLDPMAEGLLLCLIGEECKNKEKYLNLDKEYEFEILIGFATDTHDILGLITEGRPQCSVVVSDLDKFLGRLIGVQNQVYPSYSSKTVNGKQLHSLSRAGLIEEEDLPSREVKISEIKELSRKILNGSDLQTEIHRRINLVNGDFRQKEILAKWDEFLTVKEKCSFEIIKFRLICSSGTYVRALVRDISKQSGIPMCVFSIKRTTVGEYVVTNSK